MHLKAYKRLFTPSLNSHHALKKLIKKIKYCIMIVRKKKFNFIISNKPNTIKMMQYDIPILLILLNIYLYFF